MINECASRPSVDVRCLHVWRPSSRPLWLISVNSGGKVLTTDAGWSSSVARRAHNPEVAGSNPVPATRKTRYLNEKSLRYRVLYCPDMTESLCYSLPFSQTQARRRGGGTITQHRGLSINAPAGRMTIFARARSRGREVAEEDFHRLIGVDTGCLPPENAKAV